VTEHPIEIHHPLFSSFEAIPVGCIPILEPWAHTFKTLGYREFSWMNKDPMEGKKKKKKQRKKERKSVLPSTHHPSMVVCL
jgi:hypothetical protein